MALLYPDDMDFAAVYDKYAYENLNVQMLQEVNNLWERLKVESSSLGSGIYIACAVLVLALIVYFVLSYMRKLRRRRYYW